jgi:S1-C subfamily serine protease
MLVTDKRGRPRARLPLPLTLFAILAIAIAGCSPEQAPGAAGPTSASVATPSPVATPAALAAATPASISTATALPPTPAPTPTSAPLAQTATPTAAAARPIVAQSAAPGQLDSAGRSTVASAVYRMAGQSVVNITSLALVQTRQGTSSQPQGLGSGFVLDDQGYIATNNHVVEQAQELTVTFFDGSTVPAQLIGRDPDNDLAVVKVDPNASVGNKTVKSLLKPVKLGDSSKLVVGEDVVAIGSPLGLQQTVTSGIVSALRNPGEDIAQGEITILGGAVQTDAAINPGNSGGPLFNAVGEVMGVNTWGLSPSGGSIGIGLSIPVNVVKRVVPQLTANGCYKHPLIGVSTRSLASMSASTRSALQVPANQQGLLVEAASEGAASAGIKGGTRAVAIGGTQVRAGGDIIVAIDGQPTTVPNDLGAYVENNKKPGDTVTITVLRDGQKQDVKVTLSAKTPTVPCR